MGLVLLGAGQGQGRCAAGCWQVGVKAARRRTVGPMSLLLPVFGPLQPEACVWAKGKCRYASGTLRPAAIDVFAQNLALLTLLCNAPFLLHTLDPNA